MNPYDLTVFMDRAVKNLVEEAERKGYLAGGNAWREHYDFRLRFWASRSQDPRDPPHVITRERDVAEVLRSEEATREFVSGFYREVWDWINPPAPEPVEPHLRRGRAVTAL